MIDVILAEPAVYLLLEVEVLSQLLVDWLPLSYKILAR